MYLYLINIYSQDLISIAAMAQSVARKSHNLKVVSSILTGRRPKIFFSLSIQEKQLANALPKRVADVCSLVMYPTSVGYNTKIILIQQYSSRK